jgi:tetratricopeptide (TPR) repeat protein
MGTPPPSSELDSQIQRALEFHQSDRIDESLSLLRELLHLYPDQFQLLTRAGTLFIRMGRTEEGLAALEKSLQINPSQIEALSHYANGLGMAGRFKDALSVYDRAIALQPSHVPVHINRGITLENSGRWADSLASYSRALALQPDHAVALVRRGVLFYKFRRLEEALTDFDRAVAVDPRNVEAHYNRGNTLCALKRFEESLESYDRALILNRDNAETHNNKGVVLQQLQRFEEALASFDRSIALQSDLAEVHFNRAVVLRALGRWDAAVDAYNRVLALNPHHVQALNNRGSALRTLGHLEEAFEDFKRATFLKPESVEAHNNLGIVLRELHRFDEALACYNRAISLQPNEEGTQPLGETVVNHDPAAQRTYAYTRFNKSLLELLLGDFEHGWRDYEWRWKSEQEKDRRFFAQPLWLGDKPLEGKVILIHAEQGYGDTIQFCRYIPMIEKLGAHVILVIPKEVAPLLSTLPGKRVLVYKAETLPAFDFHCPMMSLPLAFKTALETIPAETPYLSADPRKREVWREKLGIPAQPRVGLVWSGKSTHKNDRNRSIPLKVLAPLFDLPFEFHSLQKEYDASEEEALRGFGNLRDHHKDLGDFSDTAALASEMDLVISVDTSTAHLAGAMGKPVWVLLPHIPDFRWLLDRSDSPWYPTATLLRQPARGDWGSVVSEVVTKLARLFQGPRPTSPA